MTTANKNRHSSHSETPNDQFYQFKYRNQKHQNLVFILVFFAITSLDIDMSILFRIQINYIWNCCRYCDILLKYVRIKKQWNRTNIIKCLFISTREAKALCRHHNRSTLIQTFSFLDRAFELERKEIHTELELELEQLVPRYVAACTSKVNQLGGEEKENRNNDILWLQSDVCLFLLFSTDKSFGARAFQQQFHCVFSTCLLFFLQTFSAVIWICSTFLARFVWFLGIYLNFNCSCSGTDRKIVNFLKKF